MDTQNLEDLKESLYRKGFGSELNAELEELMKSGRPEFMLEHLTKVDKDELGYRIHFRRDEERDKVFLNTIDMAIFKSPDIQEMREHSFSAHQLITAMEAYRMLKFGDLVAVNKTLFNKEGQQYNTWLSLDVKGQKDEYNNYPVNSYHENYFTKKLGKPFDLTEALKHLPVAVKELESATFTAIIEKSLKKAKLVTVTIMHNGQEAKGMLAVNPSAGEVNVYDSQMKLIEAKQQKQETAPEVKNATPAATQEDVKKKPWGQQNQNKVNWTKTNQRKGQRP